MSVYSRGDADRERDKQDKKKKPDVVDEIGNAFEQVGKMFLQEDLAGLKKKLSDKSEACGKEAATLKQQKEHVDEAAKKVTADFQEFIKAHLVQAPTEGATGWLLGADVHAAPASAHGLFAPLASRVLSLETPRGAPC